MAAAAAEPAVQSSPEEVVFRAASTARSLQKLADRGHQVATVIDVGASNGQWTTVARRVWPESSALLIEAQPCHRGALEAYCRTTPRCGFVLAAASDEPGGEVFFDDSDPFGGLASTTESGAAKTRVPTTTIDHEVRERGLVGPYLVKLDTHGYEVPILKGAEATLREASVAVIECYNFKIAEGCLLFWEMCAFMAERGFAVIDFSEPMWRQRDGAFWQMDIFFAPASSPEFSHKGYA